MGKRRKGDPVNGWVVVDKPAGVTSTQVVNRVRRVFNARKVGHGGTLDPLGTGVLPIALGEATKTIPFIVDAAKRYRFTVRWGQATDTDDAEGEVTETSERRPSEAEIRAALPRLTGVIEQRPPAFSAIKLGGRRAYRLAREGLEPELKPRPVRVQRFDLVRADDRDHATFEVECGKGTYMRALARDLGRILGALAHIVALRRLAVGAFTEELAISLESLEAVGHSAAALEHLLPVETALDDIPALALTEIEASRLRCGQTVSMLARSNRQRIQDLRQGATICATAAGKPVALVRYEAGDLRPVRVLNL